MAGYSIARRTTNVTSGQTSHGIITASTDRASVLEAGLFMAAATASLYSLGRPAANGVTPASPVNLLAEDAASPAAATTSVLSWTTSPTSPTNDLRRWAGPATIGAGVIFTFPRGIVVAISQNFVWQNLATNGVVDSYFVIDE